MDHSDVDLAHVTAAKVDLALGRLPVARSRRCETLDVHSFAVVDVEKCTSVNGAARPRIALTRVAVMSMLGEPSNALPVAPVLDQYCEGFTENDFVMVAVPPLTNAVAAGVSPAIGQREWSKGK